MQQGIGYKREEIEAMLVANAAALAGVDARQLRVTWTVSGMEVFAFVSNVEHGIGVSLPTGGSPS